MKESFICKIKGGGNLISFGCYDAKVTKIFARPLNLSQIFGVLAADWVCDLKMFVFSTRKTQSSCLFNLIYKSFYSITFKAPRPSKRPLAGIKWRPTIFSWINEQNHVFHGINVSIFRCLWYLVTECLWFTDWNWRDSHNYSHKVISDMMPSPPPEKDNKIKFLLH